MTGFTAGDFPLDLVLFAMIAVFLVLRLRSVLGRRTGFERGSGAASPVDRPTPPGGAAAGPVIEGQAEAAPARPVPESSSPLGGELARIHVIDRGFDPAHFLAGAEGAFRLIVGAFASGDRAALRPLLGDDIYASFDQVITAREQAGETQRSEIKAIPSATIEEANLRGSLASIAVRFVSDQVALTLDREGKPVAGADAATEIVDHWTFERDLTHPGPNWRLVATRSG
jgi:predicted lipid-binding transport protein (Tim44 family)